LDVGESMQKIICALSVFCFFACHSNTPLFTHKQIIKQLDVTRNDWKTNRWYVIIEILSNEPNALEEIITVEKSRTGDFKLTYFVNVDNNNKNSDNNTKYNKIQKTITKNNKKHETIQDIEKIRTKLTNWSDQIMLDGYTYKLEIDTITAKTIMVLDEIAFESGMESIKTWIDNVRSLKR